MRSSIGPVLVVETGFEANPSMSANDPIADIAQLADVEP